MALTKVTYSMIDGASINVLDYGASGNGTDDNTTAFTNALTALSSGGTLYIPAGTYIVNSQITVPYGNIKIEGEGIGNTIVKIKANFTDQTDLFAFASLDNVEIKDITFNGNIDNQGITGATDNKQNAISLTGTSSNYLITNCEFVDWGKDGIYIGSSSNKRISIIGNLFDNIRRDCVTIIGGEQILVDGNHFYNGKDYAYPVTNAGVWIEANNSSQPTHGVTVTGNTFKNMLSGVGCYNGQGATVDGIVISSNSFDTIVNTAAVAVYGVLNPTVISGNNFVSCGNTTTTGWSKDGGAISAYAAYGFSIVGNTFKLCGGYLATIGFQSSCRHPVISGNTFNNDKRHGISADYVFGSTSTDVGTLRTISGNMFADGGSDASSTYYCVYLKDTVTHPNNGDCIEGNAFKISASSGYYGGVYCGYGNPFFGVNSFIGDGLKTNIVNNSYSRMVGYNGAAPVGGTYQRGEYVLNSAPSSGSYIGWICTVAGTPGTWKGFGAIA